MKLCLGSVSCVIENRLESEDNELERRLLRTTTSSTSDASSRPASALPRPAAASLPLSNSHASTKSQAVGPAAIDHDLPLSHTWHGGGNHRSTPSHAGGVDGGGGGSSTGGSRTNLLRASKIWGTGRSYRAEQDGREWTTASNALEAAADATTGTPTKSVKFSLGRKKTESVILPWGTSGDGGAGAGATSDAPTRSRAATTGGDNSQAGEKTRAAEEVTDQRAAVMNVIVQARFWADYFNNTLRCWEALLDPFR